MHVCVRACVRSCACVHAFVSHLWYGLIHKENIMYFRNVIILSFYFQPWIYWQCPPPPPPLDMLRMALKLVTALALLDVTSPTPRPHLVVIGNLHFWNPHTLISNCNNFQTDWTILKFSMTWSHFHQSRMLFINFLYSD